MSRHRRVLIARQRYHGARPPRDHQATPEAIARVGATRPASTAPCSRKTATPTTGRACSAEHTGLVSDAPNGGFTLAEALVAISVATIAGTALLTALANSVQSSSILLRRTIGLGLAQQMLDEIAATAFPVYPDGYTPGQHESATNRLPFDDIDDYHGWSSRPPVDRDGRPLGSGGTIRNGTYLPRPTSMQVNPLLMERFSRSVTVEFVEPAADGKWLVRSKPTDWRRVTVTIRHTDLAGRTQTVATLTEVFARIPQ